MHRFHNPTSLWVRWVWVVVSPVSCQQWVYQLQLLCWGGWVGGWRGVNRSERSASSGRRMSLHPNTRPEPPDSILYHCFRHFDSVRRLSQVVSVLCWCSKLSKDQTVINSKALLWLPVNFSHAICLNASIWGTVILAVFFIFTSLKAHGSSWP